MYCNRDPNLQPLNVNSVAFWPTLVTLLSDHHDHPANNNSNNNKTIQIKIM